MVIIIPARNRLRLLGGTGPALFLVFLIPSLVLRGLAPLLGMLVLTAYSCTAPADLVKAPRFWLGLLWCIGGWVAMFFAITACCDLLTGGMKEGGMVFLMPMMVFPPAVLIAMLCWPAADARRRAAEKSASEASAQPPGSTP